MLNLERIPIGKLKLAYGLNDQEAEILLSALWPDGVFPYALWEQAYNTVWKDAVNYNIAVFMMDPDSMSPFPKFDKLEYKSFLPHIYRNAITRFFNKVSRNTFALQLIDGINYIIESIYDNNSNTVKNDIDYILNSILLIEKNNKIKYEPDSLLTWKFCITADNFKNAFDEKALFFSSYSSSFIAKIFYDSIVVDKSAAVRHLFNCGYPLRQEIKGISKAIVERITAALLARPQDAAPSLPFAAINVSRALWEGKPPAAIRDAMRNAEFDESVIAYVLFEWHGLTNKTQLGRLLSKKEQDEKSYRNLIDRLLDKAASLTIESV